MSGNATSYATLKGSSKVSAINQEKIPSNTKDILTVTFTQFNRNRFSRTENFVTRRIIRDEVVIKPNVTSI